MHGLGGGGFGGGGFGGGGFGGGGGSGGGGGGGSRKGGGLGSGVGIPGVGKELPRKGIVQPGVPSSGRQTPEQIADALGGKVDTQVVAGGEGSQRAPLPTIDWLPGAGTPPPTTLPTGETAALREPVAHVVVFARYSNENGKRLIEDLGYLDEDSGDHFHLILAGYSEDPPAADAPRGNLSQPVPIQAGRRTWYYDPAEFVRQKNLAQSTTTWKYNGGVQLLIFDVKVPGRRPATFKEMFGKRRGEFQHVITAGVEELKEKGLVRDFDALFQKLTQFIPRTVDPGDKRGPTFQLSDALGLTATQENFARAVAKAFELKWKDALEEILKFKHFAVRDIRK